MDPSERVLLGNSKVAVTRLAVGTNPLGNLYTPVTDKDTERVLAAALDAGIRYFDTAPLYGFGLAEERLGRVLRSRPSHEYVISTKVGRLLRRDAPPPPVHSVLTPQEGESLFPGAPPRYPVFDYSEDGVLTSISESLERLGLDRVDIVYIHDPDDHYDEALRGAYRALERLRSEGVIGAIGVGMNQTEMLARFAREGDFDCFLLAGRYSLLDQQALDDLFAVCLDRNISIVLGGVFNGGILADQGTAWYDYRPADHAVVQKADELRQVCGRYGVSLPAAALQFSLAHPAVTCVVVGVRSVTELQEDIGHLNASIPPELWVELKNRGLIHENAAVPYHAAQA